MKKSSEKRARRVDCLGLGIMPLDFLFEVERFPGPGQKCDAAELTIQGGGPIPNAMVGLKRMGLSVALIAGVTDDVVGRMGAEELTREGIETNLLIWKRRGSSDTAGGYVERGTGRRTIVLYRNLRLNPRDIRVTNLPKPDVVHLDGRDLEAGMKLARWGRRLGARICFDVGSMRNDVSPIFPLVDHLVVADSYALPFTGAKTARRAIERLRSLCPGAIVVTEGVRGSLGLEAGRWHRQKAWRVKNVDTTGAGDAFHVGYIYGLKRGWDLSERMRYGAAVAALKCTRAGARAGMPRRLEVERFLRSKPRAYA